MRTDRLRVNVAFGGAGDGPPILLLHGWPHTWQVWSSLMPLLARDHRVIAPDLRGLGGTERPDGGYDATSLADDAAALLDALGEPEAIVVGIDAGVPPAFLLAASRPERIRALVVMESLLGRQPGAEAFLAGGAPWWFGFHAVPGLAERVLEGHEREYVEWFLRSGTVGGRGVADEIRVAFGDAYAQPGALRAGFETYRAMPESAGQIAAAVERGGFSVPTLAVSGGVVGDALHRQLLPVAKHLESAAIPDCAHLVPLEQPEALHRAIVEFLGRAL